MLDRAVGNERRNSRYKEMAMTGELGDMDSRDIQTYGYSDVARYLGLSKSTVRAWVRGTSYTVRNGGKRRFMPVIERPDDSIPLLSFTNLIELHVLSAMRNNYRVSLQKVRQALEYIEKEFPTSHPLVKMRFSTDQVNLFVDIWGRILAVSGKQGQVNIRRVVEAYFDRIECDEAGLAARFYPFTRISNGKWSSGDQPRVVVIDPLIAFGRPTIVGTGVPTAVLAERFKTGETIKNLADDYMCQRHLIEEAIRAEQHLAA